MKILPPLRAAWFATLALSSGTLVAMVESPDPAREEGAENGVQGWEIKRVGQALASVFEVGIPTGNGGGGHSKPYLQRVPPRTVLIAPSAAASFDSSAKSADSGSGGAAAKDAPALSLSAFRDRLNASNRATAEVSSDESNTDVQPASASPHGASDASGQAEVYAGRVGDGSTTQGSASSVPSGAERGADVDALFPRPYEQALSESRLLVFFPLEGEASGRLQSSKVLVPAYATSDFTPPVQTSPRSSASYRTN